MYTIIICNLIIVIYVLLFWIGSLITQHKGLNSTHDWNRNKRIEKPK